MNINLTSRRLIHPIVPSVEPVFPSIVVRSIFRAFSKASMAMAVNMGTVWQILQRQKITEAGQGRGRVMMKRWDEEVMKAGRRSACTGSLLQLVLFPLPSRTAERLTMQGDGRWSEVDGQEDIDGG